MSIHKLSKYFFPLYIVLLIPSFLVAQVEVPSGIGEAVAEIQFKKVILDNRVYYRNVQTNEFVTYSDYMRHWQPKKEKSIQVKSPTVHRTIYDYWETDQVNPYKEVVLPTPFKIAFNQTRFTHPVDGDIVITSRFGRRRRGPHRGLDIDLVTGDAVRSVLSGKVRFVGYSSGHGKTVVVRHDNEVETVYAHLSDYAVKVNDYLSEGQVLGFGGNTGRSRGSHLHLEVRYKGVCIHPEYVFNFDGSQTIRGSELWVTNNWKSPRAHSAYRKSKFTPIYTETEAIAAQTAEPRFHRVRKGETLSHIANRYHLRLREICSLNTISTTSVLSIGQIIQIR